MIARIFICALLTVFVLAAEKQLPPGFTLPPGVTLPTGIVLPTIPGQTNGPTIPIVLPTFPPTSPAELPSGTTDLAVKKDQTVNFDAKEITLGDTVNLANTTDGRLIAMIAYDLTALNGKGADSAYIKFNDFTYNCGTADNCDRNVLVAIGLPQFYDWVEGDRTIFNTYNDTTTVTTSAPSGTAAIFPALAILTNGMTSVPLLNVKDFVNNALKYQQKEITFFMVVASGTFTFPSHRSSSSPSILAVVPTNDPIPTVATVPFTFPPTSAGSPTVASAPTTTGINGATNAPARSDAATVSMGLALVSAIAAVLLL